MTTLLYTLESLAEELAYEQHLLASMEQAIPELPEGHLSVLHDKATPQFYHVFQKDNHKTRIAIPRAYEDGNALINELADKSVIRKIRPILRQNIKAIQRTLQTVSIPNPHQCPNSIYASSNLFPYGISDPAAWANGPYPTNPKAREHCIYETKKKDFTRSKSEAWIANTIYDNALFYRYESAFTRYGKTVYPDFQIIRPKDGALIIWEHFGGLHIPGYPEDTLQKILFYTKCGFTLGDTFFYTMETQEHPLQYRDIKAVIDSILSF